MKKVIFSDELESLVLQEGREKYEGRRFKTITVWVTAGYRSSESAEHAVRDKVEDHAMLHHADAYELFAVHTFDSKQEYDARPYTATATAILYKSK